MGLFDKLKEPIFLKENSSAEYKLEKLNELVTNKNVPSENAAKIEKDIKLIEAGIYGEKNIAFELKNSHMPMYVLHDLNLYCGELSAQIDYLIITHRKVYIIECKNLFGNIEINNKGEFIRTVNYGYKNIREAIYSPITQNKRHLELIKQLLMDTKGDVKSRFLKSFYYFFSTIIVLSNPKTILNDRFAPKEIQKQVIRVDQLIDYIHNDNIESSKIGDKDMNELSKFFLSSHKEKIEDYAAQYKLSDVIAEEPDVTETADPIEPLLLCPKCGSPMVLRKATKGTNAGNSFYGCSRYPKCNCIINCTDNK
ncbi:MAG: NERD domain-containing protein [Clostridiales bacterium]|jgi:hypothetical protein|nr:NERD domain-containing protein [Clostridiales bacterium]